MSGTWYGAPRPPPRIGPLGWLRALLRGAVLGVLVFGGLAVLLVLRLVERPLCGQARPVTPWITQGVCRGALGVIGLRYHRRGCPMRMRGAVVANHSSWLDIFVLNAADRVYFVSKAEVAAWPGIGWLARATGTLFIRRDPREAGRQRTVFAERLNAGHRLLFFPEGTSSDGRRVLDFKSTLFGAFFTDDIKNDLYLQPITVFYTAPHGEDARFYGWWGDMAFAPHLLCVLAVARQGAVEVTYHQPVAVSEFSDRKALAAYLKHAVGDPFTVISDD